MVHLEGLGLDLEVILNRPYGKNEMGRYVLDSSDSDQGRATGFFLKNVMGNWV